MEGFPFAGSVTVIIIIFIALIKSLLLHHMAEGRAAQRQFGTVRDGLGALHQFGVT